MDRPMACRRVCGVHRLTGAIDSRSRLYRGTLIQMPAKISSFCRDLQTIVFPVLSQGYDQGTWSVHERILGSKVSGMRALREGRARFLHCSTGWNMLADSSMQRVAHGIQHPTRCESADEQIHKTMELRHPLDAWAFCFLKAADG